MQLREASKYQKKSRTKMCVLALIITVIAGIVIVCIYVGVKYVPHLPTPLLFINFFPLLFFSFFQVEVDAHLHLCTIAMRG